MVYQAGEPKRRLPGSPAETPRRKENEVASYVLVHGGAHGGWCYGRVARILRSAGHDVHTPTLTGVGERSHLLREDIDLDLHIRDILAVLHYEDLRDAILVGHSYGGMVVTGVADRAADRVGHIVYLDAATPVDGESLAQLAAPLMKAARRQARVVDGVELVLFPGTEPMPHYGVTDPDDITWMEQRLTPHPWRCFEQPLRLTNEAALWEIPQTHIVCTSTLSTRDPARMERARADGRVWDIDTGHDLMISEPEAVAEMLLRVAEVTPPAAK
jgi:pimeloyl-ACP methyl ester carboxylesterase